MIASFETSSPSYAAAVSREGAVADGAWASYAVATGPTPTWQLPFSWLVLELDAAFPESLRPHFVDDPDFPSQHALGVARSLLYDVDRIFGLTSSFSDLESFDGDLLLYWRSGNCGIVLICPANGSRSPKIYREVLREGVAFETDLHQDPRASDLAGLINWVRNPA